MTTENIDLDSLDNETLRDQAHEVLLRWGHEDLYEWLRIHELLKAAGGYVDPATETSILRRKVLQALEEGKDLPWFLGHE